MAGLFAYWKRPLLASIAASLCSAIPALADERTDTVAKCVSAFAAGDVAAYSEATAAILAWGEVSDPNLRKAATACLALSPEGVAGSAALIALPNENADKDTNQLPDRAASYLERLDADPNTIADIAKEIAESGVLEASDERAHELETALLAYAKPLPTSNSAENLIAYSALSHIDSGNATYQGKIAYYSAAVEDQARADKDLKARIVGRLIKTTAEFDGSSWYRHPSSPRYQDIQSYVTLYVLETGSGQRSLEFFLNYTSRNGWLFVESAQINVDGEITSLPAATWSRDNDTEIWEWTGYRNQPKMIELAKRIAESKRAVVRFNGQQFYDDHVISSKEKLVIHDMLIAWEAMKP